MGRLYCVILLTPEVERQRAFYADQLGLQPSRSDAAMTTFALRGSSLVLQPQAEGAAAEMRIALTAKSLEARMTALRAKAVAFEGDVVENDLCRMALVRDPEGNLVQLVEPRVALAEGRWPRLSHVIISARKFDESVAFYRETLGLKVAKDDDEHWVEFDTGETRLTVHDRADADALPLHADQRMAFALEDQDFDAWIEELRGKSMKFAAAPAEGEHGPQAEVEDGDGWLVVLRGPESEEPLDEDALDAEYGDDDDSPHGLPRRGGELGSEASKRPAYNPAKAARKQAARAGKVAPPEPERGGFVPRAGSSSSRPFTPRPAGPPREGGSRPFTPREGGPPRPFTPREGSPRPYTPREGAPRSDAPRPPRPAGPPRPDRDRIERRDQPLAHVARERVELVRAVERDRRDAVRDVEQDGLGPFGLARRAGGRHTRSTSTAMPWPPLTHSVAMP